MIKPEVSAPGVNVRSCVGHDDYDFYDGTSMAAPHVSGAILLLKEAFPYLTGEDLMMALYMSATDLGATGEDNTYGMGMINVKAAYDLLAIDNTPVLPAASAKDLELVAIIEPSNPFTCFADGNSIIPQLTVRNNGTAAVTGFTVFYSYNDGQEISVDFTSETLASGQSSVLTLPVIDLDADPTQSLYTRIQPIADEYDVFNNNDKFTWIQLSQIDLATNELSEPFTNGIDPNLWTVGNPAMDQLKWDTITGLQIDGTIGKVAHISAYPNSPYNAPDFLYSPYLKLPEIVENGTLPTLNFDLFHRKRYNNPAYQDTLIIYAVDQCLGFSTQGTVVYKAGGSQLYTVETGVAGTLPLAAEEWLNVNVPIENLPDGAEGFYLNFEFRSRGLNTLLLDNINVQMETPTSVEELGSNSFRIYPNPSDGMFQIESLEFQSGAMINIYDLTGRKLETLRYLGSAYPIDLNALDRGVYILEMKDTSRRGTQKILLQ